MVGLLGALPLAFAATPHVPGRPNPEGPLFLLIQIDQPLGVSPRIGSRAALGAGATMKYCESHDSSVAAVASLPAEHYVTIPTPGRLSRARPSGAVGASPRASDVGTW